jgi:hypothetical protein
MAVAGSGLEIGRARGINWPAVSSLLALACLCAAAAITADTLYLVIAYFQPLYFWDSWSIVEHYTDFVQNKYSLKELFEQHNEHRIAFPRLIFFADVVFSHALNVINIASIFLIQFLHAFLLIAIGRRLDKGIGVFFSISVVFILLFTFGQNENFTWGFQVQFVGVFAAATLSFWMFCLAAGQEFLGTKGLAQFAISLLMAFVATYTMANGVLSSLVLIALGLCLRVRGVILLSTLILALLLFFSYYYNFHAEDDHPSLLAQVSQHPIPLVIYAAGYLGGPVRSYSSTAAAALGAAGLVLTLTAALRMAAAKEQSASRSTLVGVMLFVVATAAATAAGRLYLGADQVISGRYLTPANIFWAAQALYWKPLAWTDAPARFKFVLYSALCLIVIAGAAHEHFEARPYARENYQNLNLASDALLSGADAPSALEQVYFNADYVRRHAQFLDQQHLSIFAWPEARLRGRRLVDSVERIDNEACLGAFDQIEPLPQADDFAVLGWAWDRRRGRPVNRILLVDSEGDIVGFASGGWPRLDVLEVVRQIRQEEVGWRGFVKSSGKRPFAAYAYLDDGRIACKLGESRG